MSSILIRTIFSIFFFFSKNIFKHTQWHGNFSKNVAFYFVTRIHDVFYVLRWAYKLTCERGIRNRYLVFGLHKVLPLYWRRRFCFRTAGLQTYYKNTKAFDLKGKIKVSKGQLPRQFFIIFTKNYAWSWKCFVPFYFLADSRIAS